MSRHGPVRRWPSMIAVPVAVVLAGPAAAADDPGPVAVSTDALHWSNGLTEPLFDPDVRWVPGDLRTAAFFVRNGGPTPATIQLQVRAVDDALLRTGDIRFAARADGGTWAALDQDSATSLLRVEPLPVADHSTIEIRAEFDPASSNQSQQSSADLWFDVRLSQSVVEGDANPTGGNGLLPDTGAPALAPLVLAGAGLLGVGVGLARRRREERHG